MVTVTGDIVHWTACDLFFLLGIFSAHISGLHQFFLNLNKIGFGEGNIQGIADRFQIMDIIRGFLNELGQCLKGTFLFIVFVEVFLRIFSWCQSRIKRNGNLFVRIIIKSSKFPGIRS